jgi:hypothetical protein
MRLNIKNHIVLIDDSDWDIVKDYHWRIYKSFNTYYARGYLKNLPVKSQKQIRMHRLIMDAPDGVEVDHENRNGLDCRRQNLRLITHSGNQRNKTLFDKTGFQGVKKFL